MSTDGVSKKDEKREGVGRKEILPLAPYFPFLYLLLHMLLQIMNTDYAGLQAKVMHNLN